MSSRRGAFLKSLSGQQLKETPKLSPAHHAEAESNLSPSVTRDAQKAAVRHGLRIDANVPFEYVPEVDVIKGELYGHVHFLRVGNADSSRDDQGGALGPRHSLWKDGKVLHHAWALLVKHPHGQQRHAGAVVLEGQVEAVLRQRAEAPHFRVDLHQASAEVHLREAFVRRDGVHLEVRRLHPEGGAFGGDDGVGLVVVEVEGLFARAGDFGDGAAVAHRESDLHVDALRSTPVDEGGEQPVVLTGVEDVAHLVGPDGVEVFIIATHLLPLQKEKERADG
ncbi:hypothetical protein EYF80_033894 [Liparis tanakae]|uniref:Uncharacterized protein n=1 Tax=Liparis tanakae TaxID=230148 RepID=A0A4Z2GRZ7_9TELE|nr:hypothetical protein EYF80_033894 [Liparis tanakae]